MESEQQLTTAEDFVDDYADELQLPEEMRDAAMELAGKAAWEYPINRRSEITAAASIYLSGLYHNHKIQQEELAAMVGCDPNTISRAYRLIAHYEYGWEKPPTYDGTQSENSKSPTDDGTGGQSAGKLLAAISRWVSQRGDEDE